MHPQEKGQLYGLLLLGSLFGGALLGFQHFVGEQYHSPTGVTFIINNLIRFPQIYGTALASLAAAAVLLIAVDKLGGSVFAGAIFKKHLRGTRLVSGAALRRLTLDQQIEVVRQVDADGRVRRQRFAVPQVMVAGIPMPRDVEPLHTLISGSIGSGKTVAVKEMLYSVLRRRSDRIACCDPGGELFSQFGRPGDRILNPFDERTEGWSIFNELRNEEDYDNAALALVPLGRTATEETWCAYGRLMVRETARKLRMVGVPRDRTFVGELHRWTTLAPPEALKAFLAGTEAEAMFTGADQALAGARFTLSTNLAPHLRMPNGPFSIRDWLADPHAGNLFITWREGQIEALRPLVSAWISVLCTEVLNRPYGVRDPDPVWLFLDEIASLAKLATLNQAATKGRKAGLRLVAGLQDVAQLTEIYGQHEARTLRSCFRNLVVLGGARTGAETAEEMSRSLGEHEVERLSFTKTHGAKGGGRGNTSTRIDRERVVLPAEISGLPPLEGFVAFAGDYPVARATLNIQQFTQLNEPFVIRSTAFDAREA